jgi:hypothetical protein
MQPIVFLKQYPEVIQKQLKLMTPLAIEIANRWVMGWPEAVTALIESGEYLEALERQEQQEREIFSLPGNSHLARHEILQEFGLSLSPPEL